MRWFESADTNLASVSAEGLQFSTVTCKVSLKSLHLFPSDAVDLFLVLYIDYVSPIDLLIFHCNCGILLPLSRLSRAKGFGSHHGTYSTTRA